jgi:hypothetical protein
MSRTDKDTPDWVTATWWKPRHACHPRRWIRERQYFTFNGGQLVPYRTVPAHWIPARGCDLPPEPAGTWPAPGWPRGMGCHWEPDHTGGRRRWYSSPPRWYRRHVWYGVERTRLRTERQHMIKEYRAGGTVDTIPATDQHRHCATWLWS